MILVQLTDLHVRPEGLAACRVVETNALTERAFRAVANFGVRPDAVVISGDITANGLAAEYRVLADMLRRRLGHVPVYMIPGNHDDRATLRAELAEWPGIAADPGHVRYTAQAGPVRLVMLDTLVNGAIHGELGPDNLAWLDAALLAERDMPTIVAMHHPPFLCGITHMDRVKLRDSAAFAEVVSRHPHVERVICGHHHRAITARVGGTIASVAPSVAYQGELELRPDAPARFVLEPGAFDVHAWTAESGVVSHTGTVESFPGPYPFVPDAATSA